MKGYLGDNMYKKIFLGFCFFSMFIFDGFLENIWIVIFTIGVYQLCINKDKKDIFKSFIASYLILNILILIFFQENLMLKELEVYSEKKSKKVVVLVYEGEDKKYNLKERAKEVYNKEGFYAIFTMAYKLSKYKDMYEDLGSSPLKNKSYTTREKLSKKLGKEYMVVNSNLYTNPYLEETLVDLVNNGHKEIILCPLFLTKGKDYDLLKKRIDHMGILKYEIKIKITDLFWNSEVLAKAYKDEIIHSIKNKEKATGVLLVGLEDKNNLEEDILFREKIKKYILDEKTYNIKIKLPLLENHKKDIIKTGAELLEYGIDSLYLVIPTSVFETIYIQYLAEYIFKELNIPSETKFYYIGPWNEKDVFIEELYKKIKLVENEGGA